MKKLCAFTLGLAFLIGSQADSRAAAPSPSSQIDQLVGRSLESHGAERLGVRCCCVAVTVRWEDGLGHTSKGRHR